MRAARTVLVAVGVGMMALGGWLLVTTSQPLQVAPWVIGPVLAHDLLLAPLLLGTAWLGHRVLPRYALAPALVALVVVGALTAVAASVITRPGARSDNPSLLDRNYVAGYLVAVSLTVGIAVVAAWLSRRRTLAAGGHHDV